MSEHTLVPQANEIQVAAILETILAVRCDLSDMMIAGREGWDWNVVEVSVSVLDHCGWSGCGAGFLKIEKPSPLDLGDSDGAQEGAEDEEGWLNDVCGTRRSKWR